MLLLVMAIWLSDVIKNCPNYYSRQRKH